MSALRPKWFSEVAQGLREMAQRNANDFTISDLVEYIQQNELPLREQMRHDGIEIRESTPRERAILMAIFEVEFAQVTLRRLEEAE